jgi:hypothetical protein
MTWKNIKSDINVIERPITLNGIDFGTVCSGFWLAYQSVQHDMWLAVVKFISRNPGTHLYITGLISWLLLCAVRLKNPLQ